MSATARTQFQRRIVSFFDINITFVDVVSVICETPQKNDFFDHFKFNHPDLKLAFWKHTACMDIVLIFKKMICKRFIFGKFLQSVKFYLG